MTTYSVYVIQNPQARVYIGVSENVAHRLNDHNSGLSQWTKNKGPWHLLWTSDRMSLSQARQLENKLKRMKGGNGFFRFTGLTRLPRS